jgi:SAM-dependent methyltransferase
MTSTFDQYRANYEAVVEDSIAFSGLRHDFFLRAKAVQLAELFAEHFGADGPALLDVGCGVGRLHPLLAPIVGRLAGTDVSTEAIARARSEHDGVDYRVMEAGGLPWPDESFDAGLAVCVFHHVPPPERAALLVEMRRVVRSGGLIVIIEHNPLNPATRLAVLRCPFDADAVLLSARVTRSLLARADLTHIESRYFLAFPTESRRTAAIERKLRRVPLGAQHVTFGTRP